MQPLFSGHAGGPIAVDESQSSALKYICVCLLAAWDASFEGPNGRRTFEAVSAMARRFYKLELIGEIGDVVPFDPWRHELTADDQSPVSSVRIIRPGIVWTDGSRTETLIRALAKM